MGYRFKFFPKLLSLGRKSKNSHKHLLVLDIGTEYVKAIVLRVESELSDQGIGREKGVVLGFGTQRQLGENMLAGAVADIEGVATVCMLAINQASEMARVRPTKAVIGVAGEFVKGITNNYVYQRNAPKEEIGMVELQNFIQRIQYKAYDKARRSLSYETGRNEIEIKPINALVTEIRIDGYQISNPLGFQGKEVFLSIFNVYAPIVHLKAVESIAAKLGLEVMSIAAESYALTRCSSFNPEEGAIFIDVGGGTTDIALVRQGKVEGIKSLSIAGRSFTKRLSQIFNLSFDQAEEIKLRHADSQLSESVQGKINKILMQDVNIWLNGVELVLEDFSSSEIMPSSIQLCGGGSLLPSIKNGLSSNTNRDKWNSKFAFASPITVDFIESRHINNIIDSTEQLTGAQYITPLALANLALEIASGESKVLPPLLRRVVRIMR